MTEVPYAKFKEFPATKIFLDTNAVIDLADHELACQGKPTSKAPKLVGFLAEARKNSSLVSSPLVIEEIFHLRNSKAMQDACAARGRSDEKALRRDFPAEYAVARKRALLYLAVSIESLAKHGVSLAMPVPEGKDDKERARWTRDFMVSFVARATSDSALGAMDAMHIVWGQALGCDAFISRDSDIRAVPGITVFVP